MVTAATPEFTLSTSEIRGQIEKVRQEVEQARVERDAIEKQVADAWTADPDTEAMRRYSTLLARIGGGAQRIKQLEALLPAAEQVEALAELETATAAAVAGFRDMVALDKKVAAAQQKLADLISEHSARNDEVRTLAFRRTEAEKRCRQVGVEAGVIHALADANRVEGYF